MAVFRVERNKGYTVMSNHHLRNKELSLKAKGLLSQMLSLPEDWDYTLAGLSFINREKIDAIREAVKELERAGYIVRSRERDEKGRLRGADYVIFEQPQTPPVSDLPTLENPTLDNPTLEKPTQEKPTLENPTQLNKDIQKTNLPKKEKSNIDLSSTDSIAELSKAQDKEQTAGQEQPDKEENAAPEQPKQEASAQEKAAFIPETVYRVRRNPYSDRKENAYLLQAYVTQENGRAKMGAVLFTGTPQKCRELMGQLKSGELTEGQVKELYAKAQETAKTAEQDKSTFSIYQLKHGDETRDLRFEPYDRLQATGNVVDKANYELVYSAELTPGTSLEDIYTRFNIDHPKDFKGHSLSVSDVVVLHQNGQDAAHYVDSFGYKNVPEFLQEQKQLRCVV